MSDRKGAFGRCCADMQNVQISTAGNRLWRPVPVEHGHPPQLKLYQSDWSVRILAAKLARLGTFGTGGFLPVFASFACGIWWLATLLLALGWLIGWHHRCHKWLAQGHLKLLTRWRDTKTATVSVCVLIRLDFNTAVSSILAIVGDGAVKGIKIAEHCKNCTICTMFYARLFLFFCQLSPRTCQLPVLCFRNL